MKKFITIAVLNVVCLIASPLIYVHNLYHLRISVWGMEIKSILNGQLKPGTYEVEWDGTNLASGVYYYKLVAVSFGETTDFSETKKMLMIK